jgi:uncharacterized membrane protein
MSNKQDQHWLVRPDTIRKLWIGLIIVLALTVIAEFAIHKHAYFRLDKLFGFYAWYGFLTCVAMVFGAKLLGLVLKRPDDYYAENDDV